MTEILGRYEILEKIGEGGFAIVYRARDLELDRFVALKELRSLLLTDETWVKRFRREARAIARLDHPHIVTIYDVGQVNGRHFLVMRLVNGSSLEAVIAKRGRLPWLEVAQISVATAEGLNYAHSRGILHRDLKPGNILIDAERGPMLTDFGLAKLAGESSHSLTISGDIIGTPYYIAPEAWEGQTVTPQADIYALGCILYEMIKGEKLFQGETPPAVMMAHFKPLELPAVWPEDVPPEIIDILNTALARKPADRYTSALAMAQAIATLSGDTLASFVSTTSQELMPDAPDLAVFQQQLETRVQKSEQPTAAPTPPPQVILVKEENRWRGCLWLSAALGVALVAVLLLGFGRLCATLSTTLTNIIPTVEVGETVDESIHIPLPSENEVINLDIEFGSGELTIRPGAEDFLVEGSAAYNVEQLKPIILIEKEDIRLRHDNPIGLASFTTSNLKNQWNLKLSDSPMALTIDTGAARGDLELGGLALTNLEVTQGAANFELGFSTPNQVDMETLEFKAGGSIVNLTALANARAEEIIFQGGFGDFTLDFSGELRRDVEVTLEGGAGSFSLLIPEGVAAEVRVESQDVDVKTQGIWEQLSNNLYSLPGEGHQITVQVTMDAGNLRLRNR